MGVGGYPPCFSHTLPTWDVPGRPVDKRRCIPFGIFLQKPLMGGLPCTTTHKKQNFRTLLSKYWCLHPHHFTIIKTQRLQLVKMLKLALERPNVRGPFRVCVYFLEFLGHLAHHRKQEAKINTSKATGENGFED